LSTVKLSAPPARAVAPGAASPFRGTLVDLCFERGFARLTVAGLCARAGLGRAAFYRRYADLPDCLVQVSCAELDRWRRCAEVARADAGDWRSRLRATAYALYRFLEEDERLGRLLLVELRSAGERPARLIDAEVDALAELIDEGRALPTAPATLTRATAEALGGAIFHELLLAIAGEGSLSPEGELVPILLYAAVLPYAGPASAAEELRIPPPPR
jgi:AcrR family transcriptional regulator